MKTRLRPSALRRSLAFRIQAGFSLVELLVALSILGTILVLTIVNLKPQHSDSQSRALATMLASELRLARQNAIATQSPVAVVVPSNGGASPYSQSIYVVSGESKGHITRVVNYSKDFDQAVIFEGLWPLANSTAIVTPGVFGANPAAVSPASWLSGAMLSDYCFIFTPDGGVTSNGLPFFDGSYHLVTSVGAKFQSATPSGSPPNPHPSYFAPTALGKPWTITVTQQGEISSSSGLQGQSGAVPDLESAGLQVPPALPPALQDLPMSAPFVQSLTILPVPPSAPPVGFNTTITASGRASLQLYSTDPSARDLYVQWHAACTSGGAPNGGNFSFSGKERMAWDSSNQRWSSIWDWSPPFGVPTDETFHLRCSLGDGANVTLEPPGQDIKVIPTLPIYFAIDSASDGTFQFWKIHPDGSSPTLLLKRPRIGSGGGSNSWGSFTLSPDASKLVWCTVRALIVRSLPTLDILQQLGGVGLTGYQSAAISPHGNMIAAYNVAFPPGQPEDYHPTSLTVCNLDGSNSRVFAPPATINPGGEVAIEALSWSPDQTKILASSGWNPNPTSVSILDVASGTWSQVNIGFQSRALHWSADNWIYAQSNPGTNIFRVRPDGTALSAAIPAPGIGVSYSISPDGSKIVYVDTSYKMWTMKTDGSSCKLIKDLVADLGLSPQFDVPVSWGR